MTIKKNYYNGKLASVGFDSLEEVFAYLKLNGQGLQEVPSNELKLDNGGRQKIHQMKEFQDFRNKIEKAKEVKQP